MSALEEHHVPFDRTGPFPEPVRIGPRSVRWRKSDVVTWLTARPLASEVETLRK